VEEVDKITTANAKKLFKFWGGLWRKS
jgi:hypothetical protein